jgi:hypothetical protein
MTKPAHIILKLAKGGRVLAYRADRFSFRNYPMKLADAKLQIETGTALSVQRVGTASAGFWARWTAEGTV